MAEHSFEDAQGLVDYHRTLTEAHRRRDYQILELQTMWAAPIRTTDTGRTVWINNEPWTATRVIVNAGTSGTIKTRAFAPPPEDDEEYEAGRERKGALTEFERLFSSHWMQTDDRLMQQKRNEYRRELFYYMAVHGWYAGIDLCLDLVEGEWPFFSDLWNPLDTHPDMDSTALVNRRRVRYGKLKRMFGPDRRAGKAVPGWELKLMKNSREEMPGDTDVMVLDYWDDETEMIVGMTQGGEAMVIKEQTGHGVGFNPAFCRPVDGAPFRSSSTNPDGEVLNQPDPWSNEWLLTVGQSPMLGYKTAFRYACELAEQYATVVERYASPWILVKTAEGKWAPFDTSNPDPQFLENTTIVDVVKPPTFPVDDRAWFQAVLDEISKASFPREVYGMHANSEAQTVIQMMNLASSYVLDPLIQQGERTQEMSVNSLVRQAIKRGKQYTKSFALRGIRGSQRVVAYYRVDKIPDGMELTVQYKGAGLKQDKIQTLLAITQAANAPQKPMSLESMLDQFMELDAPEEEVAKIIEEMLTTNPKVIGAISPITTLYKFVEAFRDRATPRSRAIAAALEAQAVASLDEIKQEAKSSMIPKPVGQAPPGGGGPAIGPPPGAPPMLPPGPLPPGLPPGPPPPMILGPNGRPLPPVMPPGGPPPLGGIPAGAVGPPQPNQLQGILEALARRGATPAGIR